MRDLIVTPFLDEYLVLCPGRPGALRLPCGQYSELLETAELLGPCPCWLADTTMRYWQRDVRNRPLAEVAIVRRPSPHGYVRATYELNLGCNYDCEHCYLGLKRFSGMTWPQREKSARCRRWPNNWV
jgi:hypothetical protein